MNTGKSRLDAAFLEKQRQYLQRLRANLRTAGWRGKGRIRIGYAAGH